MANMALAAILRKQIEAALERRIPSALTPAAKVRSAVQATGIRALDELLSPQRTSSLGTPAPPQRTSSLGTPVAGGLPEGAISELVGPECSGRTAVALKFVAGMTRAGKVCAWIDVTDSLDPVSAAAAGVDLRRMLWVRCGVSGEVAWRQRRFESGRFEFRVPEQYFVPPAVKKGLHGGGFGGHPRNEVRGLSQAVDGLFEDAEEVVGAKSNSNDKSRSPAGMTERNTRAKASATATVKATTTATANTGVSPLRPAASGRDDGFGGRRLGLPGSFGRDDGFSGTRPEITRRPWGRMEQAMRAADLLLQAGGFGAVVIDMGGLPPEFCSRVPLATWFRYRAAAERTRASVVLLTQYACAKSSAEVVLRMEAEEVLAEPTVFAGLRPRATFGGAGRGARRRHEADCEASEFSSSNVVSIRKPPRRETGASWESRTVIGGVVSG